MIKDFLIKTYISYIEQVLNGNDKKKKEYTISKIKNNNRIINYATTIENDKFKSNIIVAKLLKEQDFIKTLKYRKIVNQIFENKKLANEKLHNLSSPTFLLLVLENDNLLLSKEQKEMLILIAKEAKYTEKYIKEISSSNYGTGLYDIKFRLLNNKSFSFIEKKELFDLLYSDEEIKISILRELEWIIIQKLNLKINTDNNYELYELNLNELPNKIVEEINFCKYIKSTIPDEYKKRYLNT